MTLASTVADDYEIPADVLEITGRDPVPVWLNETGGLTVKFRPAGPASGLRYLKRNVLPSSENLELEAQKLTWLNSRHPVPHVVDYARKSEIQYLITEALPGDNAVAPESESHHCRNRQRAETTPRVAGRRLPLDLVDQGPYRTASQGSFRQATTGQTLRAIQGLGR